VPRLLLAVLAAALAVPAATAATSPTLPAPAQVTADRATFLRLAEQGMVQTRSKWWNAQAGWYKGNSSGDPPVASLWSSYPLIAATAAVAIAHPTDANKQAVDTIAKRAEAFWDPTLANGSGGVSWLFGLRNTGNAYFDDTGWWGLAYLDAYRATGNKRWLWDAGRALGFIDRFGWDRAGGGGTWWNVAHEHKTSEPLAAAALIAATLYRIQHKPYYLEIAKRYIGWANANTLNKQQGSLYGRSDTDRTIMDYVEGMMIAAHAELCDGTKVQAYCTKARQLATASLNEFPTDAAWAPETDVVYLRWLLRLYEQDKDPRWYALVYRNAKRAQANARDPQGFWSLHWDGGYGLPGALYTQAATLELFAWAAAEKPPAAA
jgi:uncharacterized protein YyaL (SSP411 family)